MHVARGQARFFIVVILSTISIELLGMLEIAMEKLIRLA
jgi:hypothetical protein